MSDGLPVISRMVGRGRMVYVSGLTPEPAGDVQGQTQQVLLSDMSLREAHDAAWNAWIDPRPPPLRVCRRAELPRRDALVEITVTAAK